MKDVTPLKAARPLMLEFFVGVGLARMGLESKGFHVTWANDHEPSKKAMYDAQFGESDDHDFVLGDVGDTTADTLPHYASLAWRPLRAQTCSSPGRSWARSNTSSACSKSRGTTIPLSLFWRTSSGWPLHLGCSSSTR